jgi:predicted dehydrogenase
MMGSDGMSYAPSAPRDEKVCGKGEFVVAAAGLIHGHIYGMCQNLQEAGADIAYVYDRDPALVALFGKQFPDAQPVDDLEAILENKSIRMVATADIPSQRGPLGLRVLGAGKHFFSDKAPFTDSRQLAAARAATKRTGLKWGVCYSERLQNKAAVLAGNLIQQGRIGEVVQVLGMGPHRLNAPTRPPYFFKKAQYGGILCDIGSHQIEQFLYYTGSGDAKIAYSAVANYNHPDYPELEDFGEAALAGTRGQSGYFRIDWFTPDGLGTWGDGRTFILGTEGYIELRKYIDIARAKRENHLYLVDGKGEHYLDAEKEVPFFPYFGALIRDCLDGTETAMSQDHAFTAADLCLKAQEMAVVLR